MSYRAPMTEVSPALVVYPQRAPTAAVFMVGSAVMLAFYLYGVGSSIAKEGVNGSDFGSLLGALFISVFFLIGLQSWLLRVDLSLPDDGRLILRWTRWPLRTRTASLPLADVVDVVIENGDGTAKIVIVTRGESIPLTKSLTSDDLTAKVAAMKVFLGLRGG